MGHVGCGWESEAWHDQGNREKQYGWSKVSEGRDAKR